MAKVAVVLSGCGVFDGSEIHEAVAILFHLSRHGAAYECFAPDITAPAVDHLTGEPTPAPRNALHEAARIARGKIRPLADLHARDFDAIAFPGGYGAAKNLCDFASKGAACTVEPHTRRVITEFHAAGKPIAMCCIAPVLGARVLGTKSGGPGATVTIGDDGATAKAIAEMGSRNIAKPVTEAHTDDANNLITAPAYMYGDAPVHQVFEGIGRMIDQALARIPARARS
jgi:enhancing lycopene biosynthesis protein 2